jgi:nucleolar protein 56
MAENKKLSTCYITNCFCGFIALDENLNIIKCKLFEREELFLKLVQWKNRELTLEEKDLIESIPETFDMINIESNKRLSDYKSLSNNEKIQLSITNIGGEYLRSNLEEVLLKIGFKDNKKTRKTIVDNYKKIAILEMKESSQEEDKLLIQSINSIDELDESISKLVERIREWYGIYFPEIEIIHNNEAYVKLIANIGNREEIIETHLKDFNIDLDISNGADIESEDIIQIKEFATSIRSLQLSRKAIEDYINIKMDKIAPNLKHLLGSSLGAKLIAHVGSMKKLASYPSGTVQILGAEKALFRHLKTGEQPPKHGIIFQHPEVRGAKWWVRGKIARTLALKISLATRKDVFSGDFDPAIAESFQEKVEEINKSNPFPSKTSKRRKEERSSLKQKFRKKEKRKGKKKNKYKDGRKLF